MQAFYKKITFKKINNYKSNHYKTKKGVLYRNITSLLQTYSPFIRIFL